MVLATVRRLRTRRPYAYATAHLANAASLLPVSNLTNLLAYHGAPASSFTVHALMALPWLSRRGRGLCGLPPVFRPIYA